jgi:hypothetical protein
MDNFDIREITYHGSGARPSLDLRSRLSWSAVFAGSFVAVAVFLSLAVLGAGLGLATAPALDGAAVGYGAAAYAALCGLAAYFCGGWIAGRLAPLGHVADSVIHGVVCWAFTAVFTAVLIATSAGAVFGGLRGLVGSAPGLGLIGGFAMILELAVCAYGARLGTRVYRYAGTTDVDVQTRERVIAGL